MPAAKIEQKGCEGKRLQCPPTPDDFAGRLLYFGNRICPFAQRAWWTFCELNCEDRVDYIHVDLGPIKPEWYQQKVNPLGTVPCLYDDSKPVFESLVVAEYLIDKFCPDSKLIPQDAYQKAMMRFLILRFGEKCIKPLYALLMNNDEEKEACLKKEARAVLVNFNSEVERYAPSSLKQPYLLGGDQLTLLDIAAVPFIDRFAATLSHYRNFEILPDDGKHDRIRAAYAACKARKAFQETSQEPSFYISVYETYASKKTAEEIAALKAKSSI